MLIREDARKLVAILALIVLWLLLINESQQSRISWDNDEGADQIVMDAEKLAGTKSQDSIYLRWRTESAVKQGTINPTATPTGPIIEKIWRTDNPTKKDTNIPTAAPSIPTAPPSNTVEPLGGTGQIATPQPNSALSDSPSVSSQEGIRRTNQPTLSAYPELISVTSKATNDQILGSASDKPQPAVFNRSNGYPEDWKLAMANAGWLSYPVTAETMNLTYTPFSQSNCGFRGLRDRLNAGEHVKIGVYADSISWGVSCYSDTWGDLNQCSWTRRLEAWFRMHYPRWNVSVINLARRGFFPDDFLSLPEEVDVADAYILEFVWVTSDRTKKLLRALKGPKLFLDISITCTNELVGCAARCGSDAEMSKVLVVPMNNRTRLPVKDAPVEKLSLETLGLPAYMCKGLWSYNQVLNKVAREESVSIASYRTVYWRELESPSPDIGFYWNGMAHPDTVAHDFMSHVVEYALWNEFQYDGPACTIPQREAKPCSTGMLSIVDPRGGSNSLQPVEVSGWRLFEDRPTKPGWIAEVFNSSSRIAFDLQIRRTLKVTYLLTYENIAPAYMTVEGCPKEVVLNPLNPSRMSRPGSASFTGVQNLPDHTFLPCLALNDSATLRVSFRAPEGKFKILLITTC